MCQIQRCSVVLQVFFRGGTSNRTKGWVAAPPHAYETWSHQSVPLGILALVLELLVDDSQGGKKVAGEEDEEGEAAHQHLHKGMTQSDIAWPRKRPPGMAQSRREGRQKHNCTQVQELQNFKTG